MKKIMFNDRYGLEQAVIARLKEMTRRQVRFPKGINDADVETAVMGIDEKGRVYFTFSTGKESFDIYPKYQIGEKVAIAQSYEKILSNHDLPRQEKPIDQEYSDGLHDAYRNPIVIRAMMNSNAYRNKMFVRADLIPHVIEITGIKVERLQDISEEDCMKEGLLAGEQEPRMYGFRLPKGTVISFLTPRKAFSALIDRISGKGTWQRSPWVYAYEFELIK